MTQSSQKNDSNDSIMSINQLNIYMLTFFGKPILLTFFGKRSISLIFFLDILNQFNWFNHTSLLSKSIDSVIYFMKTNWLSHQSTHLEKELNQFNQFCGKIESIQIDLIGIQVWLTPCYPTTLPTRGWGEVGQGHRSRGGLWGLELEPRPSPPPQHESWGSEHP